MDDLGASLEAAIEQTAEQARGFHTDAATLTKAISAAVIRPGDRKSQVFTRLIPRPEKRTPRSHASAAFGQRMSL